MSQRKGNRDKSSQGATVSAETAQPAVVTPPAPVNVARGRQKLVDALTPSQLEAEVSQLIAALAAETSQDAKKRLRRALRLRGHRGGLSHLRATTTPPAAKTA